METCDLHTHSVYSDGTLTPAEIIDLAVKKGIKAVALCDHNTIDGLPEFLSAAKERDLEAVPGAEFSVDYSGKELHLLALFIPEESFPKIDEIMNEVILRKEQNYIKLFAALNEAGYKIDYKTVKASTPKGKFNRANIAAELMRLGYTKSIKEAFNTLLSPKTGYYKEPERPDAFYMIDFINEIGAVPVLAHPFLNLSENELEAFLPKAKKAGLVGMECIYSENDEETTQKSFDLANRYGLKYSGGSDFHGDTKPGIGLGSGKGNLKIPYQFLSTLKDYKK